MRISEKQLIDVAYGIRKSLYLALLCVDKNTKNEHLDICPQEVLKSVEIRLYGLNEILNSPTGLPNILTSVIMAQTMLKVNNKDKDNYKLFRKYILDAGAEILRFVNDYLIRDGD